MINEQTDHHLDSLETVNDPSRRCSTVGSAPSNTNSNIHARLVRHTKVLQNVDDPALIHSRKQNAQSNLKRPSIISNGVVA